MNAILTGILSILAITGVMWGARRLLAWPICPICLGVGGTWLWMLVAREFGYTVDGTVLALLLGGSVAGIAGLMEKRLPPARSPLLFKTLFIPPGFVAAWALAGQHWALAAGAGVALAGLAVFFLVAPAGGEAPNAQVEELTKKMSNCC